ncbi:MAG: glutamate N-acetyltransferase / amino-acid N-acetyltransferase [Thermoplasmata archaeon]|jgi:glutamate N-acetyltransferase/amino-acid N-acetyltransferase|nr:glutamate N-acetyltransferase / amino-acid N-acetyltransferase [Thermoplasmata archaeon]
MHSVGPRVIEGGIHLVKGFKAQGFAAGIKRMRKDLSVIYSAQPGTTAAGVFTLNKVRAAPVLVSEQVVKSGHARAIVCNAGCANAATGEQGLRDAYEMQRVAAACLNLKPEEVIVASTGVIGRHLPMDIVTEGIKNCVGTLDAAEPGNVAQAMMTTDLVPKEVLVEAEVNGTVVRVGGVAKGSGMIHPNMATMLSWIVTDAAVDADALQTALRECANATFNMISVDGDTSTNDMVAVLANGAAGNPTITRGKGYQNFKEALHLVCETLAKKIARDGEGATTLLEVRIENARSLEDARFAARSVTKSPLVKTAVFGRDPNWGRILAAVGYSGAEFDPAKVDIQVKSAAGAAWVLKAGEPCETLDKDGLRRIVDKDHVVFTVDLHDGEHSATAWGCDFSYNYVKINADYTT